ncbi:uncharacterized protein LOC126892954 isoform X2 [Diabrotica virgifera virgifera]|nr:uncharacterized protein LOC126892794 isoform X2 [Diabrotica virgifera virgifera]XP_050518779.1 uncharacterized protein LOC126892794 isoform X2 [Diabrotica virgifera virgifera]XP_050518826.1 uncharacterized protein LOC126892794 isoform X2 [Diabrotica virgifera virgifera]XP_050518900.1 uncharacterized protein LOC126892954 isoform X2 [Diabrotica virgifera virgifera]XP_050518955.1 uncharacterized protein LOC126892954 isoform X2 [Diabrotica virgifera virgifera]
MKKEICSHYSKLNYINCKLKVMYDSLLDIIGFINFNNFLTDVHDKVDASNTIKFNRVHNKLINLIRDKTVYDQASQDRNNNKKFSDFQFHPRIKNLTDISFSTDEIKLLNYGLKYSVPKDLSLHDLESLSIETDVVIQNLSLSLSQRTSTRNSCYRYINKYKNKISSSSNSSSSQNSSFIDNLSFKQAQSHLKTLKSIKHKIANHNLIFSKADKGNCLVILDRDTYNNKVSSFLDDNHFIILPTDPSKRFISKLKDNIKKHSEFLSNYEAPYNKLPGNPLIPRLYGLPKIHKVGIPIRPVVSFINTPVSILSKFILNTLKNLINFTPRFTVSNSYQLVDKLQLINLNPDITMLSFDVSNLFTSVPKIETLSLVKSLLVNKSFQPNVISPILDILELCLSQDFFQFNNKFYKQPDGLAMGSCLSPFLADVFMDHLESNHIMKNPEILHWFRYVDDCLVFIAGHHDSAQQLLLKINSIHPNIKFTMELESSQAINFLDLSITRLNNQFNFGIFRKPTQTDHVIHFSSNHPLSHKLAAFRSFIHRLFSIPMSTDSFNKELNIIKQIAVNNGYDPSIIDKLIRKRESKLLQNSAFHQSSSSSAIYRSLPYHNPHLSEKIKRIVSNSSENIHISFKVGNTLGHFLTNTKDTIHYMNRSGVYRLTCSDCDASYIGRTYRSLSTRSAEHSKRDTTSAFSHHLKVNNHHLDIPDGVKLIHNIQDRNNLRLDLYEDLEISRDMRTSPNCVNRQTTLNRPFTPIHRQLFP